MSLGSEPPRKRLTALTTVVFCCALATLLVLLVWTSSTQRANATKIDTLKSELVTLRKQAREREEARKQAAVDRDVIMKAFRECRTAEDIPNLGGRRIVSNLIDGESVVFYVPDGNHVLNVRTSWEITAPAEGQSAMAADRSESKAAQESATALTEKAWSIPLVANHGYLFSIVGSQREESPVGWQLSSASDEFETRLEHLPLPPIKTSGASWSTHQIVAPPNLVDFRWFSQAAKDPSLGLSPQRPLQIGRWTKFGRRNGAGIKIYFDLQVSSDSWAVTTAAEAEMLLVLKRQQVLQEYLGDGLYRIKHDNADQDAPKTHAAPK